MGFNILDYGNLSSDTIRSDRYILIASSLNVDFVFVSSFVKGIEFVTHGVSGTSSVSQCSCR